MRRSAISQRTGTGRKLSLAIVIVIVLWGSAFPGIRAALEAYGPGELALLRFLVASAVFGAHALVARGLPVGRREWPRMVLLGATGVAGYNLALNFGEQSVSAGAASVLVATVPLLTAVLAVFMLKESLHPHLIVGVVAGLVGVGVISFGDMQEVGLNLGALFVVSAAMCQALFFVLQKKSLTRASALQVMAAATWCGTFIMLPFLPTMIDQLSIAPGAPTAAAIYLGIFPGAVAYVAWAYVLARLPASTAAPYLYVVPVVATAIAWAWLGETPNLAVVAGGIVVLSGVALAHRSAATDPRGGRIAQDHPGKPITPFRNRN